MPPRTVAKPAVENGSAEAEPRDELSEADAEFLLTLGRRVRELRDRRGMSRKLLARQSKVSERYLGHLEAGEGNISVMLLRRVASALGVSLGEILGPEEHDGVERRLIRRFLEQLPGYRMEEAIFRLMRDFGQDETARRRRVALVGLRGAGKSTLGAMLAKSLGVPCIEFNREIERDTGLPVGEVMALYGQAGYRRFERKALERIVGANERAVIVAGGGIVADEETFKLLLANCYTVWLKAKPEEHMARVMAQGDFRPMAGNEEALDDLKRILAAREPMYRKADVTIDTSGATPGETLKRLRNAIAVRA